MSLVLHSASQRLEENVWWGTMRDEICTPWGEDLWIPERTEASTDPSYSTSLVPWQHPDIGLRGFPNRLDGSHAMTLTRNPANVLKEFPTFAGASARAQQFWVVTVFTLVTWGFSWATREYHHAYPAGTSVEGKDEASPTLRWSEMWITTALDMLGWEIGFFHISIKFYKAIAPIQL